MKKVNTFLINLANDKLLLALFSGIIVIGIVLIGLALAAITWYY